jgi:hypothetical protein
MEPYTIHHTPYTIHHTPYTIHHTPYTIHHTPYTIHHTQGSIVGGPLFFCSKRAIDLPPSLKGQSEKGGKLSSISPSSLMPELYSDYSDPTYDIRTERVSTGSFLFYNCFDIRHTPYQHTNIRHTNIPTYRIPHPNLVSPPLRFLLRGCVFRRIYGIYGLLSFVVAGRFVGVPY